MRFIEMKVAHRLAWVFAAILALVLGSSWLSLHALRDANEEMRFAVQDAGERLRLLNSMSDDIGTVARVLRSIALLAGEPARQAQERTKLSAARKDYDEAWAALQTFPAVQAEETRLREAIATAATQTRALNDQVLALGLADKPHEAIELLLGQAGPASERWEAALEATMALQRKLNAQRYEHALADYERMCWQLGGAILSVVLVSVVLGWRVTRSITRQLGGEPAEAQRVAAAVAHGDFSLPITLRPGDTQSIMAELSAMQRALSQVILDVRHGAEHVAVASQQIAQGNVDLSQRTEEQATALQQTAATVGAFDEMVQHAAGGAAQAHQLAHGASEVALKGGAVVSQVVDTMRGINDSSKRIGDIIGVIDGIAFQTNILALNAAVEAARAGEQGRGFAVVASEVRALAQRSAGAAREIKDLISSSVERVEQGSALVDQAGDTMREVVDSIGRVTEIMARLSEASAQQTANMTQVAAAITQMDQATQQNASLVEETASASESMRQQSAQLVERVKVFTLAA